MRIEVT